MFTGGLAKQRRVRTTRALIYLVIVGTFAAAVLAADWALVFDKLLNPDVAAQQFPGILTTAARNTLIFTAFGFAGGFVIALVMALSRISPARPIRVFAGWYIEIFRGLPLLLTIILIGQGLPLAIPVFRGIPVFWRGVIALAVVTGAYMAETIRAGIEAIPPGQMEAGRSLGMTRAQTMRHIILPQAVRIVIPPLTNEFVLLIKDTSLISVLGVTVATKELTRWGRDGVISSANATPLVVAGIIYLVMTVPLTFLARRMERRKL